MNTLLQKILWIRTEFELVFFSNEYKSLSGKNLRTIGALFTILFFTFLALGYAIGSLESLQMKMDNPFTNWVNFPITKSAVSDKSGNVIQRYNNPNIASQFHLHKANGYNRYFLEFYKKDFSPFDHTNDTLATYKAGRTIGKDELLLKKILEIGSKNTIWVAEDTYDEEGEIKWDDCRIVITSKLMKLLGYEDPASIGHIGINQERIIVHNKKLTHGVWMPLKIAAVVHDLPDGDFICSPKLYNALTDKRYNGLLRCRDKIVLENLEGDSQFHLLTDTRENVSNLSSKISKYFAGKKPSLEFESEIMSGNRKWIGCRLFFTPIETPSIETLALFIENAKKTVPVAEYSALDCGIKICSNSSPDNLNYLAFNFDRLDDIRAFSEDMENEFGIKINMSQVEAKENFALVTNLTHAISFILLGFGILSIVLFVNNLLKTHLFEIRSNLGTFQAFGLNNKFIIHAYLKIIFSFTVLSILSSFLLAACVDRVEQWWLADESKFDLFNVWILSAVLGLIIISLFLSNRTIRHILGDTPGNLIYKR